MVKETLTIDNCTIPGWRSQLVQDLTTLMNNAMTPSNQSHNLFVPKLSILDTDKILRNCVAIVKLPNINDLLMLIVNTFIILLKSGTADQIKTVKQIIRSMYSFNQTIMNAITNQLLKSIYGSESLYQYTVCELLAEIIFVDRASSSSVSTELMKLLSETDDNKLVEKISEVLFNFNHPLNKDEYSIISNKLLPSCKSSADYRKIYALIMLHPNDETISDVLFSLYVQLLQSFKGHKMPQLFNRSIRDRLLFLQAWDLLLDKSLTDAQKINLKKILMPLKSFMPIHHPFIIKLLFKCFPTDTKLQQELLGELLDSMLTVKSTWEQTQHAADLITSLSLTEANKEYIGNILKAKYEAVSEKSTNGLFSIDLNKQISQLKVLHLFERIFPQEQRWKQKCTELKVHILSTRFDHLVKSSFAVYLCHNINEKIMQDILHSNWLTAEHKTTLKIVLSNMLKIDDMEINLSASNVVLEHYRDDNDLTKAVLVLLMKHYRNKYLAEGKLYENVEARDILLEAIKQMSFQQLKNLELLIKELNTSDEQERFLCYIYLENILFYQARAQLLECPPTESHLASLPPTIRGMIQKS